MTLKGSLITTLALMMATLFTPRIVRADQMDKKIIVSFNKSVEIPDLVLQPGTYVFKLADHGNVPNVVQVFNEDETEIYASLITISKYRNTVTDQPVFELEERNQGAPMAIDSWFYPGENTGYEFVYSKDSNVQPPVDAVENVTPDTAAEPSLLVPPADPPESESIETVRIIAFFVTPKAPKPDPDAAPVEFVAAAAAPPSELPKTASSLPLLALFGMLSLGSAAILQVAGRLSAYFARK